MGERRENALVTRLGTDEHRSLSVSGSLHRLQERSATQSTFDASAKARSERSSRQTHLHRILPPIGVHPVLGSVHEHNSNFLAERGHSVEKRGTSEGAWTEEGGNGVLAGAGEGDEVGEAAKGRRRDQYERRGRTRGKGGDECMDELYREVVAVFGGREGGEAMRRVLRKEKPKAINNEGRLREMSRRRID